MKKIAALCMSAVLLITGSYTCFAEAGGIAGMDATVIQESVQETEPVSEAPAEDTDAETESAGSGEETGAAEESAGEETGAAEENEGTVPGEESGAAEESTGEETGAGEETEGTVPGEETGATEETAQTVETVSDEEADAVSLRMENGDEGTDIRLLQETLIAEGYLSGEADGIYGSQTKIAIVSYCRAHGIDPSGLTALGILKEIVSHDESLTGDALRQNKNAVYIVQKLLIAWGFLDEAADGKLGEYTLEALQTFMQFSEKDMRAYVEAIRAEEETEASTEELGEISMAGAGTVHTIFKQQSAAALDEREVHTDGVLTRDWYDFMVSGYIPVGDSVQTGSEGPAVLRVQKQLNRMGYLATAAGLDGSFGENTALALKYFQRRNDLPETGICDEDTQRALYSVNAVYSDMYVSPYKAVVNCSTNRVTIWKWSGGGYDEQAKVFKCSTGAKKTPTIKGTFQATGHAGEWYHMKKSNCWVRYAFVIDGAYFFHSVLFGSKGAKKPTSTSVRNLGRSVSHGCVRLSVEDAKWLYEHCADGMTVVIK